MVYVDVNLGFVAAVDFIIMAKLINCGIFIILLFSSNGCSVKIFWSKRSDLIHRCYRRTHKSKLMMACSSIQKNIMCVWKGFNDEITFDSVEKPVGILNQTFV